MLDYNYPFIHIILIIAKTHKQCMVTLCDASKCFLPQTRSLADELQSANKDKVIDALRDQEEESRRLRGYLDSLLMIIMEHNPALLEIT